MQQAYNRFRLPQEITDYTPNLGHLNCCDISDCNCFKLIKHLVLSFNKSVSCSFAPFDLVTLDVWTWCINLLIRNRVDQVCTLGVANGTMHVHSWGPDLWVKWSTPCIQMSMPNIFGWVDLVGLTQLVCWLWPFNQGWPKSSLASLGLLGLLTKCRSPGSFKWSVELVFELYSVVCTFLLLV